VTCHTKSFFVSKITGHTVDLTISKIYGKFDGDFILPLGIPYEARDIMERTI
jgi:hypothetical protein